jgi:hypothetical protein
LIESGAVAEKSIFVFGVLKDGFPVVGVPWFGWDR